MKHGSIFSRLLRTVLRPVFAYASLIICVNKGAFGTYVRLATLRNQGAVPDVRREVDLDEFSLGLNDRQQRQSDSFSWATCREKGILDLLAAFGQVRDIFPDCRLTLAGDGPDRETIETTMASSSWGGSVDLLGTGEESRHSYSHPRERRVRGAVDHNTQMGGAGRHGQPSGHGLRRARCIDTQRRRPEYVRGEAGILVPEQDPEALAGSDYYAPGKR